MPNFLFFWFREFCASCYLLICILSAMLIEISLPMCTIKHKLYLNFNGLLKEKNYGVGMQHCIITNDLFQQ